MAPISFHAYKRSNSWVVSHSRLEESMHDYGLEADIISYNSAMSASQTLGCLGCLATSGTCLEEVPMIHAKATVPTRGLETDGAWTQRSKHPCGLHGSMVF